jgi:hypothetical protein
MRTSHIERDRETLAPASEILAELSLRLDEDRMIVLFYESSQANALGLVILPEDGNQSLVAGNQGQLSDW